MGATTIVLYRPVGPQERELIAATDWTCFPPRLPQQPIFYPVDNEEYARQIARDWNAKSSGSGYVLRFSLPASFMEQYPVRQVGAAVHREYWIPAEDLEKMNDSIVGTIELLASYGAP